MATDDGDWVIPPPAPGTVGFAFRKADDVELSSEVLDALSTLSRALSDDDVSGFLMSNIYYCPTKGCTSNTCVSYQACFDGGCQPKTCRIG